jgi:hypothetical protein
MTVSRMTSSSSPIYTEHRYTPIYTVDGIKESCYSRVPLAAAGGGDGGGDGGHGVGGGAAGA